MGINYCLANAKTRVAKPHRSNANDVVFCFVTWMQSFGVMVREKKGCRGHVTMCNPRKLTYFEVPKELYLCIIVDIPKPTDLEARERGACMTVTSVSAVSAADVESH